MTTPPQVWRTWRSTNGRYGLDVLVAAPSVEAAKEATEACGMEGDLQDLGESGNIRTLLFTPRPGAGTWLSFDDVVISGGRRVLEMGLQSHRSVSVLLLGPVAITRSYGYRGRSSSTTLYRHGKPERLSPSQLLALGLIDPDVAPDDIEPPPPIESAMAEALRRAGLIGERDGN